MKVIEACKSGNEFKFCFHLDETKAVGEEQRPDPSYVRSYTFGAKPPRRYTGGSLSPGRFYTDEEWRDKCYAEAVLLAKAELAAMGEPEAESLPMEGATVA